MKPAIVAIGTATPSYKQQQLVAAEMVAKALNLKPAEHRLLKSIYKSTGIDYRYSVISDFSKQPGEYEFFPNDPDLPFPSTAARMQVYKDNALNLATAAVNACIEQLKDFKLADVTHVITVSCTGMYAPGLDIELVNKLDLDPTVKRTSINFMGCYGAFNGIKMAEAICKGEPDAKVLMVSVELCTLHFQKNDSMDNMISNAIFADGAAAVVIQRPQENQKHFSLDAFHCDLLPENGKDMAWHIGDSGFDIVLSSYVPQAIQSGISAFMQRLLAQNEKTFDDIDFYAIHPGGQKILQACEDVLGLTKEDNRYSYQVLKQYGNMSSATVLFVLKAIWDDSSPADKGKQIFSCAFGPGLTLESMLLRISS